MILIPTSFFLNLTLFILCGKMNTTVQMIIHVQPHINEYLADAQIFFNHFVFQNIYSSAQRCLIKIWILLSQPPKLRQMTSAFLNSKSNLHIHIFFLKNYRNKTSKIVFKISIVCISSITQITPTFVAVRMLNSFKIYSKQMAISLIEKGHSNKARV